MPVRKLLLIMSAVLTVLILFLCCSNVQPIVLAPFGGEHPLPLGLLLFGALSTGALSGFCLAGMSTAKSEKGEKRLSEWEAQDVKLAAEVKSDREKQLESKILTLETALKQALKRG